MAKKDHFHFQPAQAGALWASAHLVLPVKQGHTLEVSLEASVTHVYATPSTTSQLTNSDADYPSPCERALWVGQPAHPA